MRTEYLTEKELKRQRRKPARTKAKPLERSSGFGMQSYSFKLYDRERLICALPIRLLPCRKPAHTEAVICANVGLIFNLILNPLGREERDTAERALGPEKVGQIDDLIRDYDLVNPDLSLRGVLVTPQARYVFYQHEPESGEKTAEHFPVEDAALVASFDPDNQSTQEA